MNDGPVFNFNYEYDDFQLNNEALIERWLLSIAKAENKMIEEISYIFLDDERLLDVNRAYLEHDFYTDIITFPLHEEGQAIEADIFISIDRVKENADNFNSSFKTELLRVMAHGLLHLCGYNDVSKDDQTQMRKKEEESLALFDQIEGST